MEPEEKKAKTVCFSRWLELACFHGGLWFLVFVMFVQMFTVGVMLLINIVAFPFLVALFAMYGFALRHRWKKDLANPPPFLLEEMER